MDEQAGTALQQLVDTKLGGRLRERVEQLRAAADNGWRRVAVAISDEAGVPVGYETLRSWALRGDWQVSDEAEQASA